MCINLCLFVDLGEAREITNDIRDIVGSVAVESLMVVLLGD